jgi:hypothetical protein
MDEPTLLCYVDFCKAGSSIPLGHHRYALHEYVKDVRADFQVCCRFPNYLYSKPVLIITIPPGTVITRQQRDRTPGHQPAYMRLCCPPSIPLSRPSSMVTHAGIPQGGTLSTVSKGGCAFGADSHPRGQYGFRQRQDNAHTLHQRARTSHMHRHWPSYKSPQLLSYVPGWLNVSAIGHRKAIGNPRTSLI